jgi:hypothetical protein
MAQRSAKAERDMMFAFGANRITCRDDRRVVHFAAGEMNWNKQWDDEPWWRKVFAAGWKGICREARKAGLTEAEARKAAEIILEEAARELAVCRAEVTVAMFKVRMLNIARVRIAEMTQKRGKFLGEECKQPPFYVSEAWRQKYRWFGN